ncbi:MAG TPA: FHA domain-containing protein [Candidatus Limnocylindria bacterium]|jgi:pSer/pThr/pTyr-binding forkhead associated (FHA) protein|nr:FHA domain-containing protein [Candidatus Limnocylindria bacterium]
MDGALLTLWIMRLAFLALIYLFLIGVVRVLIRDLRAASREPATELGRLIVLASPSGEPAVGSVFALDAVTTIGRDVNNAVVIEDPFASSEHCALTFRGRSWYVEDLASTNGTFLNGNQVDGTAPMSYGDEIQVGEVRLRLERGRR